MSLDSSQNESGFQTIRMIGNGAFGAVYLVTDPKTGAFYAMKVVKCALMNENQKQYLNREIDIMRKAVYPSLLRLAGFRFPTRDDPNATILTEYMSNGSLFDMLERERKGIAPGNWDATTKTKIVLGIAAGMRYLHSLDIIHRDLKSENILLDENLEAKIGDFGLSKFTNGVDPKSNTQRLGTPLYMAPELFQNAPYDYKVDVYAFGMIAFETVTAINPFADLSNPIALGMKIVQGERPEFPETCPEPYRRLIESCWAHEPGQRPEFGRIVELLSEDDFILPGADPRAVKEYRKKVLPEMNQVTYEMLCSLQEYCKLRMDKLDEALAHKTEEVEELKKLLAEFRSERKAMREEIEEMRNTTTSLRNENRELRAMIDKSAGDVAAHERRLDGYKQDIRNAGAHLDSLHKETDHMKKQIAGIQKQTEELASGIREAESAGPSPSVDTKTDFPPPVLRPRSPAPTAASRDKRPSSTAPITPRLMNQIEFANKPFNGICSYLSHSNDGKNIVELGLLKITGDSYNEFNDGKLHFLVDYSWTDSWGSAFSDSSWLLFDFGTRKVSVCAYSLKTYSEPEGSLHLKSWVLEGSDDLTNWVDLDNQVNDGRLNGYGLVATFKCKQNSGRLVRYLRLRQTGPSHGGPGCGFALTNIEFFGSIV